MYNNAMHKVQYFSIVDYILTDLVLGSLPFYRVSSKYQSDMPRGVDAIGN